MKAKEAQFLKLVKRIAAPLDIEFTRSPRSAYRVRLLRRNEPVIDISARSLDRLQYELAACVVAVKRSRMVQGFRAVESAAR